ncbi:MAG TPA: hypothetical protein PLX06_15315 [Fimbriimonadaceae bacterium]|nr:hypothetical protein [Fimbriimonadaceae bacterium]
MLLASIAAATLTYAFPVGSKSLYDFQVNLEGPIPMLGRAQSQVEVKMVLEVAGLGAKEGGFAVTSDLTEMRASMGGVVLPFTVENVKAFFPKTNLLVAPTGKILKTDAPDVQLPVRLPGLDSKRLPDVSFLPVELPAEGIEVGKSFTFQKNLGGSEATFTVTPTAIDETKAEMNVKLSQSYETLETANGDETKDEKAAVNRLKTELKGSGKFVFDRKLGLTKSLAADSLAVTEVTPVKGGVKSERRITTKIRVDRRETGAVVPPLNRPSSRHVFGWNLPEAVSGWIDRAEGGVWVVLRLFGIIGRN